MIKIFSKENIILLFKTLFPNKKTLDKLAESEDGSNLLFNGEKILSGADNVYDYIDKESGLEDTPVGSVISYMGITAPKHYLICDGTIYNIADYQKLADQIKKETGSYNYYGGDGITTFAVPDMRGEFVRGYDPESIRDPEGTTRGIGKHQDGTIQNEVIYIPGYGLQLNGTASGSNIFSTKVDKKTNGVNYQNFAADGRGAQVQTASFVARPTNVNVLFCIKYEPTYFMNVSYGGFSKKVLYSGNSGNTTGTLHTLSDRIINYDFLTISVKWYGTSPSITTYYVDVDELVEAIKQHPGKQHYFVCPYSSFYFFLTFKDDYVTWYIQSSVLGNSSESPNGITKIVGYAGATTDSITDEQINTEIEELWKEDSI